MPPHNKTIEDYIPEEASSKEFQCICKVTAGPSCYPSCPIFWWWRGYVYLPTRQYDLDTLVDICSLQCPPVQTLLKQFEEHFKEYLEMICLAGLRSRSRCLVGTRYGRRSVRCLGSSPWGWSEIRMMMDGWRAKSDPVINSIKLLLEFPLSHKTALASSAAVWL